MIFKGQVVVSLKEKFINEYFMFYAGNYIGDYQILLSYKATETYTVYGDSPVFTHCITALEFKDLMITYPEALNAFLVRGIYRRVEFRRIKKVFELYLGAETLEGYKELPKYIKPKDFSKRFDINYKTTSTKDQPPFLSDPDWYFNIFEPAVSMERVEAESESEMNQLQVTPEEKDTEMKRILDIKISNLDATIETMNETLNEFRGMLEDQLGAGVDFWQEICK